ncbi:MAG: hypothetical protein QM820_34075 [Minicystis sp.]
MTESQERPLNAGSAEPHAGLASRGGDDDPAGERECAQSMLWPQPLPRRLAEEMAGCDSTALTAVELKRAQYPLDTAFREAWSDIQQRFGAGAPDALHRIAVIVFKPDAIVGRRVGASLDFMASSGFLPIGHATFAYTPASARDEWRYQWNQLTLDRIRLSTLVTIAGESLVVVFRDTSPAAGIPAAVRLQELKGPTLLEQREAHHLRQILRSRSRVLKFVHAPDEPADIVRTLGIAMSAPARRRLLAHVRCALAEGRCDDPWPTIRRLEAENPSHDLDFSVSLERVLASLRDIRQGSRERTASALIEALEQCRAGRRLRWREFERNVDRCGLPVDPWDLYVVGAETIQDGYDDEAPIVAKGGRDAWLSARPHR